MSNILTANKSLGQHWLNDKNTLAKIVSYADLNCEDTVLEIGPGHGSLTDILQGLVKSIIAVEIDGNLVKELNLKITSNLTVVHGSILNFDLTSLPPEYKVVANIPYYLTSHLIRILSESTNPPEIAVLLIQKEVAERIAAKPGNMSILSITAQFYWEIKLKEIVNRNLFVPAPKVDSQIIVLNKRSKPLFELDSRIFFRLIKMGFSSRRKTLSNSLASGLRLGKVEIISAIAKAEIEPAIRPQQLSLDQWYDLYKSFSLLKLI